MARVRQLGNEMKNIKDRRFHGEMERLRSPERIELLEVERVVLLSLEGTAVKTVLDVGSGTGVFAEAFLRTGLDVIGIDANPEMVTAARRFVPRGIIQRALAEELTFRNGSIDLVFLGLVLHETTDPFKALAEARRVARQRVVVLEWPYMDETQGPPREERMASATIMALIRKAGFIKAEKLPLRHMEFYRLSP